MPCQSTAVTVVEDVFLKLFVRTVIPTVLV